MPYLHLPIQSGSNAVLARMNRRYRREEYLVLTEKLFSHVPGIALSTDIIVGFPGETEADFADTLDVVERVGYAQAFTFIYSAREGTPAASMDGQVPHDVSQERLERLVELVQSSALAFNERLIGSACEILVEGASKRDPHMLSGRIPTNQVVHIPVPEGSCAADYAGKMLQVRIESARTWHLTARIT